MKRSTILAVIAIILLAVYAGPALLLLLLVIPLAYYFNKRKEETELPRVVYASIEEVKEKYGEPDDVVVLDPSRANELSALILFYSAQDVMVMAGEEFKISNIISVIPKNMATPYTIDEYAVVISTKDPQRQTIYLRVGYYSGQASEIAAQIAAHLILTN